MPVSLLCSSNYVEMDICTGRLSLERERCIVGVVRKREGEHHSGLGLPRRPRLEDPCRSQHHPRVAATTSSSFLSLPLAPMPAGIRRKSLERAEKHAEARSKPAPSTSPTSRTSTVLNCCGISFFFLSSTTTPHPNAASHLSGVDFASWGLTGSTANMFRTSATASIS